MFLACFALLAEVGGFPGCCEDDLVLLPMDSSTVCVAFLFLVSRLLPLPLDEVVAISFEFVTLDPFPLLLAVDALSSFMCWPIGSLA